MFSFFNQPFLKDKVVLSEEIAVYGKWDAKEKIIKWHENLEKLLKRGDQ